jgi:hypothetical protein
VVKLKRNMILGLLLAFVLVMSASGLVFAHPGHEGGHAPEEITTADVSEANSGGSSSASLSGGDSDSSNYEESS